MAQVCGWFWVVRVAMVVGWLVGWVVGSGRNGAEQNYLPLFGHSDCAIFGWQKCETVYDISPCRHSAS